MRLIALICLSLGLALAPRPAPAGEPQPVVVELFTSQGCSSCPAADAFMHDLARREGVIALAYHVDYWDYLGWRDTFAQAAFTERQRAYASHSDRSHIDRRLHGIFTPEMLVQGIDSLIGSAREVIDGRIEVHGGRMAPVSVELRRGEGGLVVRLDPGPGGAGDVLVKLATFLPAATVEIDRGENAGRTMTYANVVTALSTLREWDGASAVEMELDAPEGPLAVLVQRGEAGPILGAAQLD